CFQSGFHQAWETAGRQVRATNTRYLSLFMAVTSIAVDQLKQTAIALRRGDEAVFQNARPIEADRKSVATEPQSQAGAREIERRFLARQRLQRLQMGEVREQEHVGALDALESLVEQLRGAQLE